MLALTDGRAHGVFFDSTHRVEIDLAKEDPSRVTFSAAGGDLVYYVILGPTPADVLERYTALTGRTPMPPLWALGNQQSRWSYMSADEVREIAAGSARAGSRATCSTSTSTTWTATASSRGTTNASRIPRR